MGIRLDGKRALVTGAGKGIGRCIAKHLAECGAAVVAMSRSADTLDTLKKEVPGIETAVVCDVADWDDTKRKVEALGDIRLLVNNAGLSFPESALEASESNFDKVFAVNVKAAMNISQVVARGMIARKQGGSIVHISSAASQQAMEDHLVYCASKAALDGMMKVMALEWGPHQIRVNCVNPTVVLTEMGVRVWSNPKGDALKQRIPQHKFASEQDVANAVAYLLSDQADRINGTTLAIEGGLLVS